MGELKKYIKTLIDSCNKDIESSKQEINEIYEDFVMSSINKENYINYIKGQINSMERMKFALQQDLLDIMKE